MPQPFNQAIMTNDGAKLLLRAQAGEVKMQFTRIATGNGIYTNEEKQISELQKATGLKSEKNSFGFSDINISDEHSVKLTALITNHNPLTGETLIQEGYYINEMGLFAKAIEGEESEEVLYSITTVAEGNGDFMPPYNGYSPAQIIQDYYITVNNSAEVTVQTGWGALSLATADDLMEIKETLKTVASSEEIQTIRELIKESVHVHENKLILDAINQETILSWDGKQDAEEGKGLSEENYTLEEKEKLSSVEPGAQPRIGVPVYISATAPSNTDGLWVVPPET
ncbi:MAG: hypothetical protein HFI40_11560 [Lachnospiraceae bacterium]|nr:hypothetical protein [Lachnospiraceae bacterium]